jgi:hypothetical protein
MRQHQTCCSGDVLGLANARPKSWQLLLAWQLLLLGCPTTWLRAVRPIKWAWRLNFEDTKPMDFYHHTSGMARFVTLMDSNIILESNAINSINFYINHKWIIYQQINLIKQVYTPPIRLDVLKSLMTRHVLIF